MRRLTIPKRINSADIYKFLERINNFEGSDPLEINFSALSFITTGPLVALVAVVDRWKNEGREIVVTGLENCPILYYLQRMNLLEHLEVTLPEHFVRRDATGRFVPISEITHDIETLATNIACCLAPGGENYENPISELFDLIQYIITETANNVRQHSKGTGFAVAQTKSIDGLVRLAIADNGVGILDSFRSAGFAWAANATDPDAIAEALKPNVSSKGAPVNAGVGLTMVYELVSSLGGWLAVASGNGLALTSRVKNAPVKITSLPEGAHFRGTLLGVAFRSEDVSDWSALLENAKIRAGLLRPGFRGGRFSP